MTTEAPRVIAITSGKGGVGKTHTTVNLGIALTRLGRRVLILDADLGLANVNVLLGFQPKANIAELLEGKASLQDIIVHHPSGLDIIPASSGIAELTNLNGEKQSSLIATIDELAVSYDYMLVDTAAGIGDNVLYFNTAAEDILVIIDKEPTSITDAYAVIKVLSTRCGVKNFNVIVNRCPIGNDGRSIFGQLSAATGKFLNVGMKFLGHIQEDSCVTEATVNQRPYSEMFPSSRASLDVSKIAQKIDNDKGSRNARGGMQFFFRTLVEQSS